MTLADRGAAAGRWLAPVLVALCLAAACSRPAEEPASEPGRGGTVVVATLTDVAGVNPLISQVSDIDRDLARRMIFQPLLREQADFEEGPPTFEPALAESWSWSDDRLALTFTLHDGVSWSDGAPLTAEDVRWTWQAQTHADVAWSFADKKGRITDVEVVDARTARFHFSETYPAQLTDANEGEILPRHLWSAKPFAEWRSDAGWFLENLAASGPFVVDTWLPNERITLRRNERYYREGLPRLDLVVFQVIPDKTAQINQLLGGSVDYVHQVPRDHLERLEKAPQVEIDSFWSRQFNYLCWNTRHPLFGDVEIRRALTMAIDRQQIIDTLYRGYARPSLSPVLSTVWAFNRRLEPWPYDPRAARLVLVKKGFDDGADGYLERDGARFSFELLTNSGNRVLIDAGTMIQEQLRRIGVEARLRTLEWASFVQKVRGHDFEASLGGWNVDTSLDLAWAFHSDSIDDGYNFGSYSNPEVDRLIDEARLESDLERKREMLHRLQEILHQELPYTFLLEPKRINARQRRVRGTRPNALSSFDNLDEWWIAR